jgi:hypothetical protein
MWKCNGLQTLSTPVGARAGERLATLEFSASVISLSSPCAEACRWLVQRSCLSGLDVSDYCEGSLEIAPPQYKPRFRSLVFPIRIGKTFHNYAPCLSRSISFPYRTLLLPPVLGHDVVRSTQVHTLI